VSGGSVSHPAVGCLHLVRERGPSVTSHPEKLISQAEHRPGVRSRCAGPHPAMGIQRKHCRRRYQRASAAMEGQVRGLPQLNTARRRAREVPGAASSVWCLGVVLGTGHHLGLLVGNHCGLLRLILLIRLLVVVSGWCLTSASCCPHCCFPSPLPHESLKGQIVDLTRVTTGRY